SLGRKPADGRAVKVSPDVFYALAVVELVRLPSDEAEVGSQDYVIQPEQGMAGRQRLVVKYIECGARDTVLLKCLNESGLFDNGSARGIDQVGSRLHQREFPFSNQPSRPIAEDHVYRHIV